MSKKYGIVLVLGLLLSGCYTQFAVIYEQPIRQQVPQVTYQIDSITGDTIKVVHQTDTVIQMKNCYWVRNYWGQPEYHCDGDGYYSAVWDYYNDNPWWYRSYSYYGGAYWGYPRSYYGDGRYYGGGGGGGVSSTSTQNSGSARHSRTYGVPTESSVSTSNSSSKTSAATLGSGSIGVGQSSGTSSSSGTSNGGTTSSGGNNSGNQEQGRHNPRSW